MADEKQQEIHFTLERIYLKDVSYEAPGVPQAFLQKAPPQVDVQLSVQHALLDQNNGIHEVLLIATVSAKSADKAIFLVEVQQAGLFQVLGLSGENLERALEVGGPNILLPFVREAVNDLVCKGGFPQLLLNPINFDTLYEQKKAAQQQQKSAAPQH